MIPGMELTRREFFLLLAAAGCGGSGGGNCLADGTSVQWNENHGHILFVSKEDVAAGAQKTYDIRGTSDHSHLVTLTAADMLSLQGDGRAIEVSTRDGTVPHTHTVTVTCA
jgi:hypothetical protein